MRKREKRESFLKTEGFSASVIEKLLEYTENKFTVSDETKFPLADEAFCKSWDSYCNDALSIGVFPALKKRLVQLSFPIKSGISEDFEYKLATRKGEFNSSLLERPGVEIEEPDCLEMSMYPTPVGRIPVLIIRNRNDFVTFVRALTCRNEPREIPLSMGACAVKGFNNWDRVSEYKKDWLELYPGKDWSEGFSEMVPKQELYQDRFILLSDGPYSGIDPEPLGIDMKSFREMSLAIRREHEVTHYCTLRAFGAMNNNALDEIIADFMGIVSAFGRYRADVFLTCAGLEQYPVFREGGRLKNYCTGLDEETFTAVCALVYKAANNLERFFDNSPFSISDLQAKTGVLKKLCSLTLEELADSL